MMPGQKFGRISYSIMKLGSKSGCILYLGEYSVCHLFMVDVLDLRITIDRIYVFACVYLIKHLNIRFEYQKSNINIVGDAPLVFWHFFELRVEKEGQL